MLVKGLEHCVSTGTPLAGEKTISWWPPPPSPAPVSHHGAPPAAQSGIGRSQVAPVQEHHSQGPASSLLLASSTPQWCLHAAPRRGSKLRTPTSKALSIIQGYNSCLEQGFKSHTGYADSLRHAKSVSKRLLKHTYKTKEENVISLLYLSMSGS